MNDCYIFLFVYLFCGYSFGIFMMGYLAGQDNEWKKSRGGRAQKKRDSLDQEKWLEEIKRN